MQITKQEMETLITESRRNAVLHMEWGTGELLDHHPGNQWAIKRLRQLRREGGE